MTWKNTKAFVGFFAAALVAVSAQAVTFVDIDKYENHKFPEEIRELNIPVTLLHKHKHDHGYLVYAKDYKTSSYRDDVSDYNACSWYLDESGSAVAYEYCEEKIEHDIKEVEKNLRAIEATGYEIYGTTVRPFKEEVVEFETENGHVYVRKDADDDFSAIAETVIFSPKAYATCTRVYYCVPGLGCQGHQVRFRHYKKYSSVDMIDELLATLEGK